MTNDDPDNVIASELSQLAQMTTGEESAAYRERLDSMASQDERPDTEGNAAAMVSGMIDRKFDEAWAEPVADWNAGTSPRDDFNSYLSGLRSEIAKGISIALRHTGESLIPCPRCGQLCERRVSAGRREEWECPSCLFGFDLPATE